MNIERSVELIDFDEQGEQISRGCAGQMARRSTWRARFLAGCDGAASRVRSKLAIGFPGGTYQQLFFVADVQASGPAMDGELHIDLDEADFLAAFPIGGPGRARLIGTVRDERAARPEPIAVADVSDRAIRQLEITDVRVNWFSTYRVHHRVADHFRRGRAFLLGDAGHIHRPAGGQGMNTGIGDAVNLAWKLAATLHGTAPPGLLDTYELERLAFARLLVSSTDKGFSLATAQGPLAQLARTRLVPASRRRFSGCSTCAIIYSAPSRSSRSTIDTAAERRQRREIHGGDRLPWVAGSDGDNFDSTRALDWQIHVYGSADAALQALCRSESLQLHVFPLERCSRNAGLMEKCGISAASGRLHRAGAAAAGHTPPDGTPGWRVPTQPVDCSPRAIPLTLACNASSSSRICRPLARQRSSRSTCMQCSGSRYALRSAISPL